MIINTKNKNIMKGILLKELFLWEFSIVINLLFFSKYKFISFVSKLYSRILNFSKNFKPNIFFSHGVFFINK